MVDTMESRKIKGNHAPGKLSALDLSRIKKPGRYSDGGGLTLIVQERSGGGLVMSWSVRYMIEGRRREMGLGSFPALSVTEARAHAADIVANARGRYDPTQRTRVRIDPLAVKIEKRTKDKATEVETKKAKRLQAWTFERVAREVHATLAPGWRNPKHAAQWISTIETYALPLIGEKPVGQIEVGDVLSVLKPIWTTKPETASRVRQRIDQCMRWAVAHRYAAFNPVDAAAELLPKVKREVDHHAAVPVADAPAVYQQIADAAGMAARALQLAILTAARSGEVRGVTWGEIDLKAKLWRVPAERMKAGKAHEVPLSDAAVQMLQSIGPGKPGELIFPGSNPARPGSPLSDMSLTAVMRRLELDGVPHGWRSTFRDWCAQSAVPREVAERALAHAVKDATEAAYNRTDLLEQRRPVMQRWARFVTGAAGAKVVPMRAK